MPIPKPLLHPTTEQRLSSTLSNPSHAVLLAGAPGMGKKTVARWLAAEWLETTSEKLVDHPAYVQITPDGTSIGIEAVRQLEHAIALRMPSSKAINRVIGIYDAHTLTHEAQNALLKTLEEPPVGTVIILTSSQQDALLPTIRSRAQSIELVAPTKEAVEELIAAQGSSTSAIAPILALSGGLPGLASALAQGDTSHPLVVAAQTARQLLQQSTFERLCQVDGLTKNKELGRNVASILTQMAHAALLTGRATDRWQKILQAAYDAELLLDRGGQPKLVMANLLINL